MCTVSDKLKLCTCKTKDVERLKHYWMLQRPNGQGEEMLGDIILPADIGENKNKMNVETICKKLNGGNCFDVALQHCEGDILKLHFTVANDRENDLLYNGYGNYLAYAFTFKNNRWKKAEYDPFSANADVVKQGKILHAFAIRN